MTKSAGSHDVTTLDRLREEIDRIDLELHGRLVERGEIIDRLIAAKGRQPGSSAFRPAREADMMRRLVTRHSGILPLATIESIWRIIISTFTYVQAPYAVHAGGDDARMRDSARFHFGFTVPLEMHRDADAVIAAVAAAGGDLGLVRAEGATTPWWRALTPPDAPKIIARLPFVERADHAAGLPLFIVAKPLDGAASRDVTLYSVESPATEVLKQDPDAEILAVCGDARIVAVSDTSSAERLAAACHATGEAGPPGEASPRMAFIGSHAARFQVGTC